MHFMSVHRVDISNIPFRNPPGISSPHITHVSQPGICAPGPAYLFESFSFSYPYPLFCDFDIVAVEFDSYVISSGCLCYHSRCAGPDERIKHSSACRTTGQYAGFNQLRGNVAKCKVFLRTGIYLPYIPFISPIAQIIHKLPDLVRLNLSGVAVYLLPPYLGGNRFHVSVCFPGNAFRSFLILYILAHAFYCAFGYRFRYCFSVEIIFF